MAGSEPVEFAASLVEVALPASYELGEGALYDARTGEYLHVDILGRTVTRHNAETGAVHRYALPTTVGTVVPRRGGGAVVALDDGPAALDFATGATTPLVPTFAQAPSSRCNDGKCGPDGRLYVGTMPRDCRLPVGKVRIPAAAAASRAGNGGAALRRRVHFRTYVTQVHSAHPRVARAPSCTCSTTTTRFASCSTA